MASFNREHGSRVEQGSHQVSTTTGQKMEEIYDAQDNLIGYRPVVDVPVQPVQESFPAYGVDPLAQLPDDFYKSAERGLEITRQQLQERALEAQKARDLEAFRIATRMSSASAPSSVQYAQAMTVRQHQATFAPAPTPEVATVAPLPRPDLITYPKGHDVREANASRANDQVIDRPIEKVKKPLLTKRVKRIGAIALAGGLVVGGGAFAAQNLMGGSHEAAIVDDKNITPVDPELIPALTATPLVEAFGGCMDEKGGGSVLDKGSVKSEVTTSWMMGMKGANGGELRAEFGEGAIVYPKVQLESDIDYTACVVAANVADVVSIDITNPANPVANVNLEKIDPQIRGMIDEDITKIKRGWSSSDFEPKLIKAEDLMQSGVEQKTIPADVAANFTAAYNDVPNATVEVQSAEKITVDTIAAEGSAYSEQLKTVIKQKIATSIKTKVEQLAKDNLTTAKQITVNFTGKLKTLLAKNSPAPKADRFSIPTPKAVIKDFAPIAPKAVEQTK